MSKLRELRETRARLVADLRALADQPAGEAGDLSAEQAKIFEVKRGELEVVEKAIDRQTLIDEADRRAAASPLDLAADRARDPLGREIRARYSLVRAIAGAAGLQVDDIFEIEVDQELRRRGHKFEGRAIPIAALETRTVTVTAPAAGPGGNLLGTDHRGDLAFDALQPKLIVAQLGATYLSDLVGNVAIPGLAAPMTNAWIGENEALTAEDPVIKQLSMTPKTGGFLTEFSRRLVLQASPAIEAFARDILANGLARMIDAAAIDGAGGAAPTGILSTAGVDTSTSFASPTYADVFALVDLVEEADGMVTGFALRPAVKNALRTSPLTALSGESFAMMTDTMLAGYPARASTVCPPGSIIAGNWPDLIIGTWSALDLLVNPYAEGAYAKGNVQVRALVSVDVAVRHAGSFAAGIDGPGASL